MLTRGIKREKRRAAGDQQLKAKMPPPVQSQLRSRAPKITHSTTAKTGIPIPSAIFRVVAEAVRNPR